MVQTNSFRHAPRTRTFRAPASAKEAHAPQQNFAALVREFRTQLDAYARGRKRKSAYELTAFVPAAPAKIDAGSDVRRIMRDLDFVTLQGYDFHVSGEPRTAQQSALYARDDFSVDGTVDAWRRRGAPAQKLVMGMPF